MILFQISFFEHYLNANKLPKIIWTVQQVKNEIEKNNGPKCPDAVAQAILKQPSEKISAKIIEVRDTLIKIMKVVYPYDNRVVISLGTPEVSDLFIKNCDKFYQLAVTMKTDTWRVLNSFLDYKIADLFSVYPDQVIDVVNAIGIDSQFLGGATRGSIYSMHNSLFYHMVNDDETLQQFLQYADGKETTEQFIFYLYTKYNRSIELGRPLDDLHDRATERKEYLAKLSFTQVFVLLSSDPEYFYTSTNHMLFDRLKQDAQGKNLTELFKEYGASENQIRNFLFRAINYDRLTGTNGILSNSDDINKIIDNLLRPLESEDFDPKYYYLLANSLKGFENLRYDKELLTEGVGKRLQELRDRAKEMTLIKKQEYPIRALEYIAFKVDGNTELVSEERKTEIRELDEKGVFKPSDYSNDGKLTILQVFDKHDTEKDHWVLSQKWFVKYGKPKIGSHGELIYETATAKITLFMGENEKQNNKFITDQLKKTPNKIVSFRGHSFSLTENFPFDIFGDMGAHIVFIPGSCGSSGSTAAYVTANPNTDLRFVSNTSTGRGQVTNALIDAFIDTRKPTRFDDILKKAKKQIERRGGDTSVIQIWSVGEALLSYAYSNQ